MSAADNRRSMELAFEAFNRRDFDEIRATAADDYVDHEAPPELGSGFDATQRNVGRIEAFPDVRWDVQQVVRFDTDGNEHRGYMDRTEFMQQLGVLEGAPVG